MSATARGLRGLQELAERSGWLFSERRQSILAFEVTGNLAVTSILFRAVIANDLPIGLKQGQVMHLTRRSEFGFRNGAIVSITDIS